MKKLFILLLTIMIVLSGSTVLADMGAPAIDPYDAKIVNKNGADYYKWGNNGLAKEGELKSGVILTITYEEIVNGEYYASFNFDNGYYYVKCSDIEATVPYDNTRIPTAVQWSGSVEGDHAVTVFKGPSYGYGKTDFVIPKGEVFNITGISTEYQSTVGWFYITYRGQHGWVENVFDYTGFKVNQYPVEDKDPGGNQDPGNQDPGNQGGGGGEVVDPPKNPVGRVLMFVIGAVVIGLAALMVIMTVNKGKKTIDMS
ncbi:MAG: hypothetical protein K5629_04820 [Eubacteriales bacterium]|nr:hypothetical protein [Eubacteriales bacterium]